MHSATVHKASQGHGATREESLQLEVQRTKALRGIDLTQILLDRYGASKDGRETMTLIRKTQERCRQQKWKVKSGHHVLVTDNGSFFDLLRHKGGGGAIDLVMGLEECDFERAKQYLTEWYPNHVSFAGTKSPKASRPTPEPPPSKPKALPAYPYSSPRLLPPDSAAQWQKTRSDYTAKIRNYLEKERGFPADVVDKAISRRWAYPVEKTIVDVVKSPAGEKLADQLDSLAQKHNWQFTATDTDQNDNPRTALHNGVRKPVIRLRMETRPEFDRILRAPPSYKLPGSDDQFPVEIAGIKRQPELAFPIVKFLTQTQVATSLRSLQGSHKQVVGPKSEGAFTINPLTENTKRLVLTESPNEALAYLTLKRPEADTTLFGLSGFGNISVLIPFLKQQKITVVNAFNNEGAGRRFARRIHEQLGGAGIQVEDELPPGGEVVVEADNDVENMKYFERIRSAAMEHKVRFMEKTIPRLGDTPERFRMRLESNAAIWELLDVNDPDERRRYAEAQRAGRATEGFWHFRETAVIEPVCKDWCDIMKGEERAEKRRIFTTDFAREFDRTHSYMNPTPTAGTTLKPDAAPAEPEME